MIHWELRKIIEYDMRLYSWLLLYTHCFLSFSVICLYWNTRPHKKLLKPVDNFAAIVSHRQDTDELQVQNRIQRWQGSLLASLRQNRENFPSIVSDELSATVSHAIVFGPSSSVWGDSFERQDEKSPKPRVLTLLVIAPGTRTDIFWQTLLEMQRCKDHNGFQMHVLVVIVGPLGKDSATMFQHWTRELVQKAHFTGENNQGKNKINSVTITWMQGSLQNVLRDAMSMVVTSSVIDTVLWLHPAMRSSQNICDLVRRFVIGRDVIPQSFSARCFDETQLKHYTTWVDIQTEKSMIDTGTTVASWSTHHCNIIFPLHIWQDHMQMYSTLDVHGAILWYIAGTSKHNILLKSIIVMPVNVNY
jgi:hypothetical protein